MLPCECQCVGGRGNYGVVASMLMTWRLTRNFSVAETSRISPIGVSDVLDYLSSFGCATNCGVADLNGDGAANTSDLLMMLSLFGAVCSEVFWNANLTKSGLGCSGCVLQGSLLRSLSFGGLTESSENRASSKPTMPDEQSASTCCWHLGFCCKDAPFKDDLDGLALKGRGGVRPFPHQSVQDRCRCQHRNE